MPELPLQAAAIQFRVSGSLNGTSRPGRFEVPPARVGVGVPSQAQIITVPNLGLVDLTAFARGGQLADRIVNSLLIIGPSTPVPGSVNVQLAYEGVTVKNVLTIPPAANGIYSRACILVPQGHELQLSGMLASPGNIVLAQIGFGILDTWPAHAQTKIACCCLGTTLNMFGEPAYVHAIYTEAACSRTIDSVLPTPVSRAVGTQLFVVTGSGFVDGDVMAFVNHETEQVLPVLSVTVLAGNLINVLVDVSNADLGNYDVYVAPPLSGGICGAVEFEAVTITP